MWSIEKKMAHTVALFPNNLVFKGVAPKAQHLFYYIPSCIFYLTDEYILRVNILSSREYHTMKVIEQLSQYLPHDMCRLISKFENSVTEIRIRRGRALSLTLAHGENGAYGYGDNYICPYIVYDNIMDTIIGALCQNSLYSHMDSMVEGYISIKEGFRVGVAGKAVCEDGKIKNLSSINTLNIRIPRFIYNISLDVYSFLAKSSFNKSVLIYSPPNMGKTTILRDLIRQLSLGAPPRRVVVVDTRHEIETAQLQELTHVDFLSGYPRGKGIEIATRTLSPQYIICDEIGGKDEAQSLLSSQNAGVPVVATAHASSTHDLLLRENIQILHNHRLFSDYIGIKEIRIGKAPLLSFSSASEVTVPSLI